MASKFIPINALERSFEPVVVAAKDVGSFVRKHVDPSYARDVVDVANAIDDYAPPLSGGVDGESGGDGVVGYKPAGRSTFGQEAGVGGDHNPAGGYPLGQVSTVGYHNPVGGYPLGQGSAVGYNNPAGGYPLGQGPAVGYHNPAGGYSFGQGPVVGYNQAGGSP